MITAVKSNPKPLKFIRSALLIGVAAVALSACASNRTHSSSTDFSGQSVAQAHANLASLSQRYQARPRDPQAAILFAAALRAQGNVKQAVSVIEASMNHNQNNADLQLAYAKALAAEGRFSQALNVVNNVIQPDNPDWNALSVRGAVLDQMGKHNEARQNYRQALMIAPNEASLYANLGLSFAMTNELTEAEKQLRIAVTKRGANSRVRQNLALVIGLQGRFDETRAIYARELPADHVEANMAYIRALLTQQNRWDVIANAS